jgi:hypothetical protein
LRTVTSTDVETVSQDSAASWRFFNASDRLATALVRTQHFLGSPFNHSEDCNYVCEVFLIVPTGVDRHAEVGRVGKLDLEDLRIFLGHDNVYHGEVQDRWRMRQLPLLALSVLQPVWGLEGGTHFGVMPESGTQQEFLKRSLWRNS